jgi:arylsulfatase A-like enzyme
MQLPPGDDDLGIGSLPAYQQFDGHREVAFYRAGYRGEVAFVDEQVGRLLDAVAEVGLEEESVIVFIADHGESLGEHGVWFSHGSRLTDEQVRVPLLLRDPREVARRIDRPVALLDLRSTLRGLLGLEVADPSRDLLADGNSSQPYLSTLGVLEQRQRAIIAEGHKLVMEEGPVRPRFRLYRLGEESLDLAASQPEIVARLKARLQSARQSFETDRRETRRDLSPEDREQLRVLGYGE